MPERQFGPYRLVHQIAVGGMAEIHLAKTKGIAGFEKFVALKMIHPNFTSDQQFIEMLIDEAKLTVQLQHVNIAQTFDLGRVDDTYYITMEYVDGADLYQLLRTGAERDVDTPIEVAAFIAKEVSNGLDYAHRKRDLDGESLGIVHRDVSPQNVLISHSGEVKLVDFGIAKATMRARQTAVGVIKGKYYYMSPEQAWGEPLDHRTDIFSTGILLYEMLTGQMLYLEEDLHKLLDMVRKANIAPPSTLRPDIPPQLEKITMRALSRDREDRYPTAADFATDLERFLHVYSPVFTPTKTVEWMKTVLGEKQPIEPEPEPEPEEVVIDRGRQTKQISRDLLFLDASEFTDENSVIFDASDLEAARQAKLRAERAAGEGGGDGPLPRAETSLDDPLEDSETYEPEEPVYHQGRPAHALTKQIDSSPGLGDFDDIQERTVISGPPVMESRSGAPKHPPMRLDSEPTPVASGDIGEVEGEPTIPESERTVPEVEPSPLDDLEGEATAIDTQPPTRPGRSQAPARGQSWEAAPALAAQNPKPAVSSIRRPKRSRRTPPGGVEAQNTGSVLSNLLGQKAGRPARVAIQSGSAGGNGAEIGSQGRDKAAAAGQAGHAPPPDPVASARPRQTRPQDKQSIPKGLQVAPTADGGGGQTLPGPGGPPAPAGFPSVDPALMNTSAQFAAMELDEIPDRYKLRGGGRNKVLWIWIGVVVLGIAAVTVLATVFGGDGDDTTTAGEPTTIRIDSKPAGGTAFVDGQKLEGETPTLYRDARQGQTYIIAVELPRYQRWESETAVPEGDEFMKVTATLERIPVSLKVESEPSDAEVFLNNSDKPIGRTPLHLPDLDPEAAENLLIRKRGFRPVNRKLDWSLETEKSLKFKLEK